MNEYSWLKILCIEDEPKIRELYKNVLSHHFPAIELASNGTEGLEKYFNINPHIVISDINMPEMDGLEVARKIKEYKRDSIVIIASGYSDTEYLIDAIEIGVDSFLIKPFIPNKLILKLKEHAEIIKQKELYLKTKKLLEEYKEAVDESFLVSKIDKDGLITYVNEAFCRLFKYELKELVGKNYTILRDETTPNSFFDEIWKEISNDKTWKGILKSISKDGKRYILDSVIKPIVDEKEEIVEYILMQKDITEQEEYREYLQKQLGTKEHDLREKLILLRQYERAIEISTAFCRSDRNDNILYVNDTFAEISGYSKEELIGKNKAEFLEPIGSYCKLDKKPNFWSGQVVVKRKDNTTKHLKTTIVPIYDINNKPIEYTSISQDITEVILLKEEIEATQKEFLYKLGELAELRSKETGQHVRRVANFSYAVAKAIGLRKDEQELIKLASPMHDVGKIAIPDAILNKPSKLTSQEFEIMKQHTIIGYEIFKDSKREVLQMAALISLTHHEKWDGSGYPRGLKGKEIPIFGRIVAIADVYDALGCNRVYKKAWEEDEIINYFNEQKGKHFDPDILEAFFGIIDEIRMIKEKYGDHIVFED